MFHRFRRWLFTFNPFGVCTSLEIFNPEGVKHGWQIGLNCWPSPDFLVIGIQLKNLAGRLHSEVEELVLFIIKLTLKINQ